MLPYDYSQPVLINVGNDETDQSSIGNNPNERQGLANFDAGLAAFKNGEYSKALNNLNAALKLLPNDPVVHEVRSLALFATGEYEAAAASLNSLLASAPGMDWTTMSGLYGNVNDYTTQLRKLEASASSNPSDAASHFVLVYHYLVMDAKDAAIDSLKIVVKNQPKDVTARRMLEALTPSTSNQDQDSWSTTSTLVPGSKTGLTTDLVGKWIAQAGKSKIELSITEGSQFIWKATNEGQTPVELSGNLTGDSDSIELITSSQGTMGGTVVSQGADVWLFKIAGAPKSDSGITFTRVK